MAFSKHEKVTFWGFMGAAFLSLIGGIFIFVYLVPGESAKSEVPRDVIMIFTDVFSQQGLIFSETKKYSPDLRRVADPELCARYSCLLRVAPDGLSYEMLISKGDKTWAIGPKSPVPAEVKR